MLDVPAELRSSALRLRPLSDRDAPLVLRCLSDSAVAHHLPWRAMQNRSEAEVFVERVAKAASTGRGHAFAILAAEEREPCGWIGFDRHGGTLEIGYVLERDHWGRGLAGIALRTLTDWALAQPSIWRVEARCHPDNAGSLRVLEKAGFEREALLRRAARFPNLEEAPQDCLLLARVK